MAGGCCIPSRVRSHHPSWPPMLLKTWPPPHKLQFPDFCRIPGEASPEARRGEMVPHEWEPDPESMFDQKYFHFSLHNGLKMPLSKAMFKIQSEKNPKQEKRLLLCQKNVLCSNLLRTHG